MKHSKHNPQFVRNNISHCHNIQRSFTTTYMLSQYSSSLSWFLLLFVVITLPLLRLLARKPTGFTTIQNFIDHPIHIPLPKSFIIRSILSSPQSSQSWSHNNKRVRQRQSKYLLYWKPREIFYQLIYIEFKFIFKKCCVQSYSWKVLKD